MKSHLVLVSALAPAALAAPSSPPAHQSPLCFLSGTSNIPSDLLETVTDLSSRISCSPARRTISTVPDITISPSAPHASRQHLSFSNINFAESDQSPLSFSLGAFRTRTPLASTSLSLLEDELALYYATEAGLASLGRKMDSDLPRLFLEFQIARVRRAQKQPGIPTWRKDQVVDGLLNEMIRLARVEGEKQELVDELRDMAIPPHLELRRERF